MIRRCHVLCVAFVGAGWSRGNCIPLLHAMITMTISTHPSLWSIPQLPPSASSLRYLPLLPPSSSSLRSLHSLPPPAPCIRLLSPIRPSAFSLSEHAPSPSAPARSKTNTRVTTMQTWKAIHASNVVIHDELQQLQQLRGMKKSKGSANACRLDLSGSVRLRCLLEQRGRM